MSDDGEWWVCGRGLAPDEPRRQVQIPTSAAAFSVWQTGVACLACDRDYDWCRRGVGGPRRVEIRPLHLPVQDGASVRSAQSIGAAGLLS